VAKRKQCSMSALTGGSKDSVQAASCGCVAGDRDPHRVRAESSTRRENGRAGAWRFSRRTTPESDLLAELDERVNLLARYQADFDAGDFADGDARQLHGGIAYERDHIEAIVSELESRQRARAYGYRAASIPAESDLPARFAAARTIDAAHVIRELTGQPGTRAGKTWKFICPFHGDGQERTPSLVAFPGERGWHCFSCRRGGDAVALLAEFRSIGMVEALNLLEAGALGVRVPT
jgi:hypothetical protein